MRILYFLIMSITLAGCASTPRFELNNVNTKLTPGMALKNFTQFRGESVIWGGSIININNLSSHSQLEILAYPLGNAKLPDREEKPLGRFLARHAGFLEPANYQAGRLVTLVGQLQSVQQGKIGDASYRYPLIKVDQLHLWPRDVEQNQPRIHFGIGIGISR